MGVAQGSTSSRCGMEINSLKGLLSKQQFYSNLLNNWIHSTFKLVDTKFILLFGGWFFKSTNVIINVGAPILGR
jgi:hypothetical protein